jgi:RHS repeat-associated protein
MDYDLLGRLYERRTYNSDGSLYDTSNWSYYDNVTNAANHDHLYSDHEYGWIGALRQESVTAAGEASAYTRSTHYYHRGDMAANEPPGAHYMTLKQIDGKWFYSQTRYDDYARPIHVDQFWRPKSLEGPEHNTHPTWHSYGQTTVYGADGFITEVLDRAGHEWYSARPSELNARGQLEFYYLGEYGSDAKVDPSYHDKNGWIIGQTSAYGSTNYQANSYDFDNLGNLVGRTEGPTGSTQSETFGYDALNRLTHVDGTERVKYFANGNIKNKNINTDAALETYAYGVNAGPHAVTSAGDLTYEYDDNGRMILRKKSGSKVFDTQWAPFGKPERMSTWTGAMKTSSSHFLYNASQQRIIHSVKENSDWTRRTLYASGSMELEQVWDANLPGTDPETGQSGSWSTSLARVTFTGPVGTLGTMTLDPDTGGAGMKRNLFLLDHLGSIQVVLEDDLSDTAAPIAVPRYSYDAWGNPRNPSDWSQTEGLSNPGWDSDRGDDPATRRGYTGHEMLQELGLVHMNGRIYDGIIGRFLSPDPFIQYPHNSQSYNRYSYVLNNPLSYTDPSGYFTNYDFDFSGYDFGLGDYGVGSSGGGSSGSFYDYDFDSGFGSSGSDWGWGSDPFSEAISSSFDNTYFSSINDYSYGDTTFGLGMSFDDWSTGGSFGFGGNYSSPFSTFASGIAGDFQLSGKKSNYGSGTRLTPGTEQALDDMLNNPNLVNQLGTLYLLSKNYGTQRDGGDVHLTEFFATLNADSANSKILYANTNTISSEEYYRGGWTASVTPAFRAYPDLFGVAHTHMIDGTPSDGADFAWDIPTLRDNNLWSVVVSPSRIYFTGPDPSQYYYLPTSDFIRAGRSNQTNVSLPSMPPQGP